MLVLKKLSLFNMSNFFPFLKNKFQIFAQQFKLLIFSLKLRRKILKN